MATVIRSAPQGGGHQNIENSVRELNGAEMLELLRSPLARAKARIPTERTARVLAAMAPFGPLPALSVDRSKQDTRLRHFNGLKDALPGLLQYWGELRADAEAEGKSKKADYIWTHAQEPLSRLAVALQDCSLCMKIEPPELNIKWPEAANMLARVWIEALKEGGVNSGISLSDHGPSMTFIMTALQRLGWATQHTPTVDAVLKELKRQKQAGQIPT